MAHKTLPRIVGILSVAIFCLLCSCTKQTTERVQGYVEGDFLYIASPFAGALVELNVERGSQVKVGDPLFSLDSTAEQAARDEAQRRLEQARATLEDLKKGKRPTELSSMQEQLKSAQAGLRLAESQFARQEKLLSSKATTEQDYDRARSELDQARHRVAQFEADLQTGQLGQRSDQVTAGEAEVRALEAALARANWELAQKHQIAPQNGLVFDTVYRKGEWVAAGHPVISLLPPQNIKVRAFVSEKKIAAMHLDGVAHIQVDGVAQRYDGKISFISPQAEYTPPVIYSRESRDKLVFLVEVKFPAEVAAQLHPGQPVDVQFDL